MSYLLGSSDTSAYTIDAVYAQNEFYIQLGSNASGGIAANSSGNVTKLNLFITSWVTASIKVCLYENNALLNSVIVPSSVGTGLVQVAFPSTAVVAGTERYRLGFYKVNSDNITLKAKTGTGNETKRRELVGSYTSPAATIGAGTFIDNEVFYWSMEDAGAATTIDTLGDGNTTVRVGGTHSVTTTGLGTLTTASTVGGKAIASASAPSGDGTITLAGFVSGQTYPAMGTVACVMSDGTLTASANRTLDTMEGWQWVNVSGLDTGDWSLGKAFSGGDTPAQLHVIDDGTGVLNADGTLTDWADSGVFTCWARMAAGGAYPGGEMVSFTFTITSSGIVINGMMVSVLRNILPPVVTDA